MNKKIISLAITFVLILCVTFYAASTVFAAPGKGISTSAETVERGSNIVVIFTIGTQTKAASDLSLKFTFNNSVFELTDYAIPEMTGAEKSVADTQKTNHIAASNTNGSVAFGYNSSDGEASIAISEVYATFTFKTKEDAALGSYYFTITDYDICSLDASGMPDAICDVSSLTASEKSVSVEVTAHTASGTSVKLNKNILALNTSASETLVATVSPDSAAGKTVTWKSDNESVATVDSTGKVTAVKNGIATITATVDGTKDTCIVTVNCIHNFIEKADVQYLVSAATCQSAAVYYKSCSKCGERDTATFTYGDKDTSNHIESSQWEQNDTEHWKVCTVPECGAILEKAEHTASDWIIDKEATESEDGSKHTECTVCGRVLETASIEKTTTDTDTNSESGKKSNMLLWIILALIIIVCGAVVAFIVVRKKK